MSANAAIESPFPPDALETNRGGRLTDLQRRNLRMMSRGTRRGELQFAGVFTILGLLVWFAAGPSKYAVAKPLIGIVLLAIAVALVVRSFLGADALTRDLRSGRVLSVEGAITRRVVSAHSEGSHATSHYIDVAGVSTHGVGGI